MTAWMNSPTHRDNVLRKDFTEVGFAVVDGTLGGEQTTLVVQMFGKPSTTRRSGYFPSTSRFQSRPQPPKPMVMLPFTSTQLASGFLVFLLGVFALDFYMASSLNL